MKKGQVLVLIIILLLFSLIGLSVKYIILSHNPVDKEATNNLIKLTEEIRQEVKIK